MDSDEEDQPAPFVVEDSQEMIPEDVADPVPADDPAPPLAPAPATPVAANPYTLDDIFGGGDSDLDDDIDTDKGLDFSSDDEKDVPAPKPLPKFKKKQRAEGEEPPSAEKRPKKKGSKRSREAEPEDPSKELDPEKAKLKQVANDFDEALNRIKHKRAKKLDGDDPEIDEMIVNLVEKMKEAAHADQEFNRLQQPAIAKIKLLNIVTNHLAKTHLYEQFLDNNLLEGMKLWLEPLRGDGSLPNLEIQMAMMNALAKLPIRSEHLRESLIGRVVMFYSKCDRVTASVSKIVNELLENWMRPILGRSQDYKQKSLKTVSFDASEVKGKKLMVDPTLIEQEYVWNL
ncbi:hypothetical protein BCR33DRAFT_250040 [Rhizoclosmatium globosum]|uniref:TFIIS N-terminal domain-containing protein n=1 Tax=Rhizoclosmatium globosum TaxID=329046 RepID=A0A1Y2CA55_9FUNG|nr:hypothetical protein BCR33DRAFT_250040 [Rhizoclosmatium globosum]|eukprot:ORY43816.1 hypothetical protein BCR33DRAFT_250040 [Rhizoclosmatium globosum]